MSMRKNRVLWGGLFATVLAVGMVAFGDPLTGIVHAPNGKVPADYVPPMISNGRLNVWSGKIFAFDEMYAVQGLLASGQFACAKVAAEFRAATLRDACVRAGCGARWVWQGMEGNVIEGGRLGFWDDHIFHQAAIAQTVVLDRKTVFPKLPN